MLAISFAYPTYSKKLAIRNSETHCGRTLRSWPGENFWGISGVADRLHPSPPHVQARAAEVKIIIFRI